MVEPTSVSTHQVTTVPRSRGKAYMKSTLQFVLIQSRMKDIKYWIFTSDINIQIMYSVERMEVVQYLSK